jgi:hypothetical protein
LHKAGTAIFVVTLCLALTGAVFQRHALACELLPMLNYQQLNSAVFIAADISNAQAVTIKGFIDSASERINDVYGKPISTPRFLITTDPELAAKWGANNTASMHRAPWRACIVIGPQGQNTDVMAHEWLHAEIQHRVGFLRFLTEIPVWFDEGAALTLDYREPFLAENINLADADIAAVKKLKNGRSFFSNNIRQNYQAAKIAVEPLIRNEQFFNDLERISLGESFDNVFLNANKSMIWQQK